MAETNPEDPHRLDEHIVEAYRPRNISEAQLLINALEDQGIKAQMGGASSSGGYAEVVGWHGSPQILTFESERDQARRIIEDYLGLDDDDTSS